MSFNIESTIWAIFFIPVISFILCVFKFKIGQMRLAGVITAFSIGLSFALSIYAFIKVLSDTAVISERLTSFSWIVIGSFDVTFGIILDPLTVSMLVVVTFVSLLVQVYSISYMSHDSGYSRYFAYMSLFTASMIGLVIASNIIQLFIFWELVGLCSYLLIGFWFTKPSAASAAKKAFLVTRIGDFGFLLAILYLIFNTDGVSQFGNSLSIVDLGGNIGEAVKLGLIAPTAVTWIAVGIFAGAVGKSGQFPLHVWLPDAMEGPTPVSALIHAATMVAAGVFLVARFFPLFSSSATAMSIVALIGGVTALLAAILALVMVDIKKVLAYSTVSQLGYMMLALGVGAYGPAIFHLVTHAFFKSLLFLGAGSVNHATDTYDMNDMGGLRKSMPKTHITFIVGAFSLIGIFPLSGFWSKDEILAYALDAGTGISMIVFILGAAAAIATACYVTRMMWMTFWKPESKNIVEKDEPVHESPNLMLLPLYILSFISIGVGFLLNPPISLGLVKKHWFNSFLYSDGHHAEFNVILAICLLIVSILTVVITLWFYSNSVNQILSGRVYNRLHSFIFNKYYFDYLYEKIVVFRIFYGVICNFTDWFDRNVVDGFTTLTSRITFQTGTILGLIQSGQTQLYAVFMVVGFLVLILWYLVGAG
ncbi:MAG: NADH-quinone oxidoreductase subunit L [SAR202 cluster bacterium]|nr:NADH-quinone oxidoreductase subunit L [SAR202 cluster bacterium]|tara:strand:+ start:1444 stop:3390 length:1947 start_codon:yes stop_codon:yes gene_type:complete